MDGKIKLDAGIKTFEIEFVDRGVTAEIAFNPSDPDLAVRFSKFQENVDKKLKTLTDIELNEDGTAKDLSFVKNIEEINEVICRELDYALGNEISKTLFQFCNPMAPINGKYFIVQFMEAIAPVIRENIQGEKKALKKHLNKYAKQ